MPVNIRDFSTPGQLIRALLEQREWTQRLLAVVLGVDESIVNKLISDTRPVDAKMAIMLGESFSVPAEWFLDLQKSFELAIERLKTPPDPKRGARAQLFGDLPIREMAKRGWIAVENVRDLKKVEAELASFFGVEPDDDVTVIPHAAKKTRASEDVTPLQLAWLYRVRQVADSMLVGRYSPASAKAVVAKLGKLLSAAEEARKVPHILAEHGIRLVLVEALPSSKIDGVCCWLNDMAPVIGLSMRHDRIDNFYFVLRHELEHVIRRDGVDSVKVDADLEGDRAGVGSELPDEERLANEAGADFCVPQAKMRKFLAVKAPFFAERDILGFARTLNIHPGLVAGQLQHHTKRYDRFRDHLVKIRHIVTPTAMVDGWGDVATVRF